MKLGRCQRCRRNLTTSATDLDRWNSEFRQGRIVALLCPECQTPEENAEAEINLATLDYHHDSAGRVRGKPKLGVPFDGETQQGD